MSLRLYCCAFVCLACSAPAAAQDSRDYGYDDVEFPYHAYVSADDVYVRSGPGQNYYPVSRLRNGESIEVYRHDPGGWYAIRPPADSFSWVNAEFIEPGEGRVARIKGDHVVARVGSNFSDIRDVIQVRLDDGEKVEVYEAKRIGTGASAETWYKIAPPAGEFRWVSGQFVDEHPPSEAARRQNPNKNLLIARHNRAAQEDFADRDERPRNRDDDSLDYERDRRESGGRESDRRDGDLHDSDRRDSDRYGERRTRRPRGDEYSERSAPDDDYYPQLDRRTRSKATNTTTAARSTDKTQRGRGDAALMTELEQIDLALSQEVAKDPRQWDLRPLRLQTDDLLSHSATAIDRGRVRLVQRKIARFEDIKQRADVVTTAQLTTDSRNQDVVRASLGGSMGVRTDLARFDGAGRLTQVYPAENGVASFALVDREGRVTQLVTPAPGVNLRAFVGQEVGLQGTLGYMPDARTPHVTAKRVTPIVGGTTVMR